MSEHISIKYFCDKCGAGLPERRNVVIVSKKGGSGSVQGLPLARQNLLRVVIQRRYYASGTSSEGWRTEAADLCFECALALLKDAANRVSQGERVSAGVEETNQRGWL